MICIRMVNHSWSYSFNVLKTLHTVKYMLRKVIQNQKACTLYTFYKYIFHSENLLEEYINPFHFPDF